MEFRRVEQQPVIGRRGLGEGPVLSDQPLDRAGKVPCATRGHWPIAQHQAKDEEARGFADRMVVVLRHGIGARRGDAPAGSVTVSICWSAAADSRTFKPP